MNDLIHQVQDDEQCRNVLNSIIYCSVLKGLRHPEVPKESQGVIEKPSCFWGTVGNPTVPQKHTCFAHPKGAHKAVFPCWCASHYSESEEELDGFFPLRFPKHLPQSGAVS